MSFDKWLEETEVYSRRGERLYEDLRMYKFNDRADEGIIMKWLRAAYEVGYDHAIKNAFTDDGK